MPDANSFNDSAYASSTSFTESSDGQSVSVQTGRPLLDTGLFIYKKEPNAALLQHYERVHEAIEGILIDEILAVDGDPDRSVSIRVEVAGRREHEASLHLIIFCAEYITKRFRTAFRSDHMKTILQPRRSDIPGLLYVIIPVDPEELCSPPQFLARTRRSSISERITFCGEALNISCGAKSKNATFGGTIKVDLGYGEPKFYGMTVGHAVEALRGDEVGLNTETTCAGHCSSTAKVGTGSDSTLLGEILLPTAYPGISSGAHVNSHDWALFPLDKPLSNKVLPKHTLLNAEETAASDYRSILIPKYPTFHDHVSDPVIMMGGVSGFSRGELSSMPARLWSGKSKKFIDTYTMELEQGKVSRGDSGAWVIHNAAPDFYGHTVARDPLGDAYVVPAPDTLKNIQECLGAVSVQLPNEKDDKTRNNPLATNLAREYKATAKVPKNKRFVKEWPERFTEIGCERPDRLKSSWVKELRKKGGDFQTMDCLDLFLYDGENSLASISAEDIRSFCDVPEQDPTVAGESRRAWLVDRNDIVSEEACQLSAKELYQHLETIGPPEEPVAQPRLIYIANPDAEYFRAVAATAPYHTVPALRDATWKHIAVHSSLSVKIPPRQFPSFQLEFHLHYYSLREDKGHERADRSVNAKVRDLSFLFSPESENASGRNFLYDVQVSMVIHGFDCTNWAAYAFVDCDAPLPLVDDEADENDALLQFVPPIAPHTSLEELRPEASLWDPRDYFLRVVACRMTLVLREWTHLVRKVKRAADNYRAENSELLERNYQAPPTSITSSFYRIVRMIELLQDLRYCFARLMLVWKRFSDSNGDVRYFDDLESRKAREALDNIDKTFEELEALEQTLLHLVNTCEKWYKTLELRMCFESNRLCFESNRVNLKSASSQPMAHKLNQKSHQLNMETSRISLETNKVALANHVVTRYANSMNQMLIPLIVVVLYLGPQKEVFELDRNLRAFILSFFLILVGVQLWIYLSRFLYRKLHQTEWWTKIGRWPLLSYVLRFVIMNELGQVESALPTTSTFEVCIAMEHRRKDTDPLRV